MKALRQGLFAGIAVVLLAGPVAGQLHFLENKDVQKDLKVSEEQIKKVGQAKRGRGVLPEELRENS